MNGVERYKFSLHPNEPLYTNVLSLRQRLKSNFPGQIRGFQNYYTPKITLINFDGGDLSDHLCFLDQVPVPDHPLSVSYRESYFNDWKGYIGLSFDPSDELIDYRENLVDLAANCGLSINDREWRYGPHITIGRTRRKRRSESKNQYTQNLRHIFNDLSDLANSTALTGTLRPGFLRQVVGDNTNVRYLFRDSLSDITRPDKDTVNGCPHVVQVDGRMPLRDMLFGTPDNPLEYVI
jgi:2'-5' RNA ligase